MTDATHTECLPAACWIVIICCDLWVSFDWTCNYCCKCSKSEPKTSKLFYCRVILQKQV
jgi:hypothetical protein